MSFINMTIAGPRNHFYQWDNNAVLMVSGCDEVHFCHAGDEKAIIVDVAYHSHCCYDHPVHGHFTEPGFAKVPVRLLESDEPLIAYGYENKNTYVRFEFNVEARPKPSSYVTPSEIPRWTTLEEELKKKMPLPTRPGKKDYILVNNGFGGGKWVDPEEVSIGGSIPFTGDPIVLERKASLPQVTVADYEADDPGFLTRYAVFHIYDGATEYKSYTVFPQFDGVSYETDAESGAVTTKFSYAYYECLDADGSGTIFTFDYENDSWSRENVTNVGENAVYTVSDTAVPNTKVINDVGYSPEKGSVLIVKFTTAVGAGAKFRINNLGNTPTAYKDIYHKGAAITNGVIGDGDTGVFVYDGTLFNLVSVDTWDEGDPGDESIFIAKYGETTNDELEQAYQAGKTLFVSRDGRVSFFDERFSPTSYRFYFQDRGDVTVTLCRNNVWSEQVVSNLQYDKAYYFPIAEGTTYSPRMRDIIKSASSTGVADTIVVGVSLKDGGAQEDNVEVACSILSPYNSETGKYGIDSEGREFVRLTGIYDNKIVTFDVASDGEDGDILWTGRNITPIATAASTYTKTETDELLDGKSSLQIVNIPGGGGGDEVNARMSQGEKQVAINYYKGTELPDSLNLHVGDDAFSVPTTGYVDKIKGTFVAEYGVTTFDELKAAYDAGNVCIVKYEYSSGSFTQNCVGLLQKYSELTETKQFMFTCYSFRHNTMIYIGCHRNSFAGTEGWWKDNEIRLVENNKTYFKVYEGQETDDDQLLINIITDGDTSSDPVIAVEFIAPGNPGRNVCVPCSTFRPGAYDSEGRRFLRLAGVYGENLVTFDIAADTENNIVLWTDRKIIPIGGGGTVDQTYDATSANAQSGKAVAEALAGKALTPTGWGVARTGIATVTFTSSKWSSSATVDVSEFGFSSGADYDVVAQPTTGGTATPWGNAIAFVNADKGASSFSVSSFTMEESLSGTVNVKYTIFAKGYGGFSGVAFLTDGDWRYKINPDNTFEAYYSKTGVSLTIQETSGNFYRSALQTLTLPTGITSAYDATPLHASVNTSHNNYPCFGALAGVATNQIKYYALSGGSRNTSPNYIVTAHVFGTLATKA